MKITNTLIAISLLGMSGTCLAESAASEHSGLASKHSALAGSHAVVSTTKVASAVVAAPLISAGTVTAATGELMVSSGKAMLKKSDKCDTPLVVTEKVITVDPAPNKITIEIQ